MPINDKSYEKMNLAIFELEKKTFPDDPVHSAIQDILGDMEHSILTDRASEELLIVYWQLKEKYSKTARELEYIAIVEEYFAKSRRG